MTTSTPLSARYDIAGITELMKRRGIIMEDETVEDALERVVSALLAADQKLEDNNADTAFAQAVRALVSDRSIVFGTPVLTNAGREGLTTAACTVLPMPIRNGMLELQKLRQSSHSALGDAIGTGYDLSDLESPAQDIKNMNTMMNDINDHLLASNKRPVASMATLRADHPDVQNFIRAKRDADFSKWRFNISVFINEELVARAANNQDWELRYSQENGSKTKVAKKIPAKNLLMEIAENAHFCGEPGILFQDRFDADNPTPQWQYKSTAPCAEVAMAEGEVCQFSYVDLTNMFIETGNKATFDFAKLARTVATLTRLMDASVQITIDNDILERPRIPAKRRIGIGVTGFGGLLFNLGIVYGSEESIQLASQISELLDFTSKRESVALAKRRGAFPVIAESRFTDEKWLRRKEPRRTGIVKANDWERLYQDILRHGIRNASTTAFPPTGTSSRIAGTTTSFEPAYELVVRQPSYNENGESSFTPVIPPYVMSALSKAFPPTSTAELTKLLQDNDYMLPSDVLIHAPHLATARQIPYESHVAIQSAFQLFADEAGAKTINMPNHSSVQDVYNAIALAYTSGLKGITVFREGCLGERAI